MASFNDIAHKKVAGVPVLYLAGGAVVILAIVAWKMKPATVPDAEVPADSGGDPNAVDESAYDGLATQGTVTVVQQPNQTTPDAVVKTNSTWVRDGSTWLVNQNLTSGTVAYAALTKYINGTDRSYDEEQLVNKVIKQFGPPPDDIAEGGTAGSAPAKKQFDNPPGVHTITGASDDSWAEIATLYYGNGAAANQDLLQFANPALGSSPGPFAIGTKITVPVYHAPVNYTVPKGKPLSWAAVAAKNGISETQLKNLNNGSAAWRNAPTLQPGQVVRVK
jgi:hypothetical protein